MPQLFPMNWIILTILFSLVMLISFIYIFYIPLKLDKITQPLSSPNNPPFKW
uniref:ATP synthase F0 subunit 8 n=1 Tax=Ixodes angustus TaxID=35564 RepID=UPI002238AF1F|nr:ATP synthase F0 subunit 8 [Ixodes angustus]UYB78161.1 ATP synthase F0 subunit 8 [Ixodes angustus]